MRWHGRPGSDAVIARDWNTQMKDSLVIRMKGVENTKGFLLPFEDRRATTAMHASVTLPSSGNTTLV
ncbi:hypothetical protein LMG28727_04784 [Paraburkholderia kirstenboschensis]|nr:hypothetical protein LMG28727_04784 [Paraburkholderia kirstenboschensis]